VSERIIERSALKAWDSQNCNACVDRKAEHVIAVGHRTDEKLASTARISLCRVCAWDLRNVIDATCWDETGEGGETP